MVCPRAKVQRARPGVWWNAKVITFHIFGDASQHPSLSLEWFAVLQTVQGWLWTKPAGPLKIVRGTFKFQLTTVVYYTI